MRKDRLWVLLIAFPLVWIAVALAMMYPYRPSGILGWSLLCASPLMLFLEKAGDVVLGNRFVARWPGSLRMFYGVVLGCASLVLLIWLARVIPFQRTHW